MKRSLRIFLDGDANNRCRRRHAGAVRSGRADAGAAGRRRCRRFIRCRRHTAALADSQVLLDEGGLTAPSLRLVPMSMQTARSPSAFNSEATSDRVNAVLQQINYANGSETPPATVTIGYDFDDGSPAPAAGGSVIVTINSVNGTRRVSRNVCADRTVQRRRRSDHAVGRHYRHRPPTTRRWWGRS